MREQDGNYEIATQESVAEAQINRALMRLHTSIPAKVVSFNPQNQTVTIAPLIKQVMNDGSLVDIPPLMDVPVQYPKGGGFIFTFPLVAGDEGIALFSERCIDAWWQTGSASAPMDYRTHDLSDAMFIAGITSVPKAISSFFTNGLSMQNLDGSTHIRLTNGTIYITGDIVHQGNNTQTGNYDITGNIAQVGGFNQTGGAGGSGMTLQGDVQTTGDVQAGSISLKSHIHSGVVSGGANTGAPQ